VLSEKGVAELKLSALPFIVEIHKNARMFGDFNYSGKLLVSDKLAGSITLALGFVCHNGIYVPNTSLKETVMNVTKPESRYQVIAIFTKWQQDKKYHTITYLHKKYSITNDCFDSVNHRIDFEKLVADSKSHRLLCICRVKLHNAIF
jgi:hypothetical protein